MATGRKTHDLVGTVWVTATKYPNYIYIHGSIGLDTYYGWQVCRDDESNWYGYETDFNVEVLPNTCTQLPPTDPRWPHATQAFIEAWEAKKVQLDTHIELFKGL